MTYTHNPQCLLFRRFNKYHKSLINNPQCAEVTLACAVTRDVAAAYVDMQEDNPRARRNHPHPRKPHDCVVWGRGNAYEPTDTELQDLRMFGCDVDFLSVTQYPIAYILNVHFRAGEWGQKPRCGSVVTCVIGGRSLYARVNRFLQVDDDDCPGYASVDWFSTPTYLCGENPLGVYVTEDGSEVREEVGTCLLRIKQIDPSPIIVECERDTGRFYMMRDTGYDTRVTE